MNALLTCDRCEIEFNEEDRLPVILSECGHTICEECVRELLTMDENERVCRECNTEVRETEEDEFRRNEKLLKIMRERANDTTSKEDGVNCTRHLEKPIEYFCKSCSTSVCVRCIYDDHNGHHLMQVEEMSNSLKQSIADLKKMLNNTKRLIDEN